VLGLKDNADEHELSDNTNSRLEEQLLELEEEGKDDMTEFLAECNVATEGGVGKNGEMVVADVARNVTTEGVGSENNSVGDALNGCLFGIVVDSQSYGGS
jgi:hypothetical protein